MIARGVIQNVARAQQINDFKGLLIGKITPTDIDGVIEYQNKAYIFIEIKYKDKDLPYGQKLALERLSNDVIKAGKSSIVLVVEHDIDDTSESVDVSSCKIRNYYFNKKWLIPKNEITVGEAIVIFLRLSKVGE